MIDIVERLLAPHYWMSGSAEGHEGENSAPLEVADEIKRLRAGNRDLQLWWDDLRTDHKRLEAENAKLRDVDNSWRTMMKETIELRSAVEAENAKLRAALEAWYNACQVDALMSGPIVKVSHSKAQDAWTLTCTALGGDA